MGAPKLKWTAEEEAALKAGIQKYGIGKWSTILKDPEFSTVLRSRSNVDLKDKWRNMSCMAHGSGSRHRVKISFRNTQLNAKQEEDAKVGGMGVEKDTELPDVTSLATSSETAKDTATQEQISRLDDLILEAITKLKEPRGSRRAAIAEYIENHYSAPPDFERTLVANLKTLTENGLLVKVKNQYRIAPRSISSTAKEYPSMLPANGAKKDPSEADTKNVPILTKAMIDAELEKLKSMSKEEIIAAAARAVEEAEAAIAAAEASAKEAEEAEAEAEAARCFADAAAKALDSQLCVSEIPLGATYKYKSKDLADN